MLRMLFLDPRARTFERNWEGVARFVVGVFRGDAARAGAAAIVRPLVDELCTKSPDFAEMWREGTVSESCDRVRRLCHPAAGDVAFEFSTLSVAGRPDLAILVYTPASADDAAKVRAIVAKRGATYDLYRKT